MTSQPGAGGDAVVELARMRYRDAHSTDELRLASWILRWSDTVAAAVRQADLHDELVRHCNGARIDVLRSRPNYEHSCTLTEQAVRSALTHRDEKEGG